MALKEWTCVVCEQKFKQGQYLGCMNDPTVEHRIESRTYYAKSLDGVRPCNLQIKVRTGRVGMDANLQKVIVADKFAIFQGGRYETQDPEVQLYLDTHCQSDLCAREMWEEIGMTPQMKDQRLRAKLTEKDTLLAKQADELERLRSLVRAEEEPVGAGSGKRK